MNHFEKVCMLAELTGNTPTVKKICFDMDGTIADLYGVENWLEMLRNYDPTPYIFAQPMVNPIELAELLNTAIENGIEVEIITWLSKESTKEYDEMVREAKKIWLDLFNIPYTNFHGVKYGTTKANTIRKELNWQDCETAILFDDNAQVRKGWHLGHAYDPAVFDICEVLRKILGE